MRFMVEGTPKQALPEEAQALIPAEMARGQELERQGLREMIVVAADFSKAWQIFKAESAEVVQQALATLPLYAFTQYTIIPLGGGA